MSNNYINFGQAGAMGEGATAHDNSFTQINLQQSLPADFDFEALGKELANFKAQRISNASSSQDFQDITDIAKIEEAAKEKDGSKVIKALKAAGAWVADFTKEVGTDVVAKMLKTQLGLGE
jgi:hypothetical protein